MKTNKKSKDNTTVKLRFPANKKRWVGVGVSLFLLIGGAFLFVGFSESLVIQIIKDQVSDQTQEKYEININDLKLNWVKHSLVLDGVHYFPVASKIEKDSDSYEVEVAHVYLELASIWEVYFERAIRVTNIQISHPDVRVYHRGKSVVKSEFSLATGDLYKVLEGFVHSFEVNDILVQHMELQYVQVNDPLKEDFVVSDLSFKIKNFKLDSNAIEEQDGFFFTEAFRLTLLNQKIDLGDGVHVLYCDSLTLSTRNNKVELFNVLLDTNSSYSPAGEDVNLYEFKLPYLGMINLDFNKAYAENILEVDSLIVQSPHIHSKLGRKSKSVVVAEKAVENDLISLILGVFKEVRLNDFLLDHAQFDVELKNEKKGVFSDINIAFNEFVLDSTDLIEDVYYPNFKDLTLEINQPAFDLNANTHLKASRLWFSTSHEVLEIDSAIFTSGQPNEKIVESKVLLQKLKLSGIKTKEIAQDSILQFDEMILDAPHVYLEYANLTTAPTKEQAVVEVFGSFFNSVEVNLIQVNKGKLVAVHHKKPKMKHEIAHIQVTYSKLKLNNDLINHPLHLLLTGTLNGTFSGLSYYENNTQSRVKVGRLHVNNKKGEIGLTHLTVQPEVHDSTRLHTQMHVQSEQIQISGIKSKKLISNNLLEAKELKMSDAHVKVELVGSGNGKNNKQWSIPDIQFSEVNLSYIDLVLLRNQASVVKFEDGFFWSKDLFLSHANGGFTYSADSLNYGLAKMYLPIKETNHHLTVQQLERSKQGVLTLTEVYYAPGFRKVVPDSVAKVQVRVPKLELTNFDELEKNNLDSLNISMLKLFQPSVSFTAAEKAKTSANKLMAHLPVDSNGLQFVKLDTFQVTQGKMAIFGNSSNPFHVVVGALDFNSYQWEITDTSKWQMDKTFWAQHVDFSLTKLDYTFPNLHLCHSLDSITFNSDQKVLAINGIYFNSWTPSSEDNDQSFSLYIPNIDVVNPNVYHYLQDSVLVIDHIKTFGGVLEADFYHKSHQRKNPFTIPKKVSGNLPFKSITVKQVALGQMDIDMRFHHANYIAPIEVDQFSLEVDSFHVERGQEVDSNRFLWANDVALKVENIYTTMDSGLYELGADSIYLSTKKKQISMTDLTLIPTVNRYEYALHKGAQKAVFTINANQFKVSDFDYFDLFYHTRINAGLVGVVSPSVDVLKDKRIPLPDPLPYKQVFPAMVKNMPITVNVDSVNVADMNVHYEEFAPKGRAPGHVILTDMNIHVNHISNDTAAWNKDSLMRIQMNALFLNEGALDFDITYNMKSVNNQFYMTTQLGKIDGTLINSFVEPVYSAKINSANVVSLNMSAAGNDSLAVGRLGFYYDNLKFELLDSDNKKKGLRTTIGNAIIKSKNKYHPFKRRKPLFFMRNVHKGWIGYLIRIQLAGISASVGFKSYNKELKTNGKELWDSFSKSDKLRSKARAKEAKRALKNAKKGNK